MTLNFNIIYTPNTFNILKLAIESLLRHSDFNYTLVANGLDEEECLDIESFVKTNNRLFFVDLPGNVTIPHGTALTHLYNTSSSEFFCFMDSDIFAFEDFSKTLNKYIRENDVFSSCKPIEWLVKDSPNGYRGHCTISPSGKNIAMTYFSVYRRTAVDPCLSEFNINFERYMRKSQVPEKVRLLLGQEDKHTWKFNTAKLLNIIQAYRNYSLFYSEIPGLIHLGGVSRFSEHSQHGTRVIKNHNLQAIDRIATRKFFHDLLSNINDKIDEIPAVEISNHALREIVLATAEKILTLSQSLQMEN